MFTYSWSTGEQTGCINVMVYPNMTYSVTVTDTSGCKAHSSHKISHVDSVRAIATVTNVSCRTLFHTGAIAVNITSGLLPVNFHWSNGEQTSHINDLTPGMYRVTMTDANGCIRIGTHYVLMPSDFAVDVNPATATIALGDSVQLMATANRTAQYEWITPINISCIQCDSPFVWPVQATVYQVIGVDSLGCMDTAFAEIFISDDYRLVIPNAFTPNGDGHNDLWFPLGNISGLQYMHTTIYNRWGELVYESSDVPFGWDGRYKGADSPPGVYIYYVQCVWKNGDRERVYKGRVTLLR